MLQFNLLRKGFLLAIAFLVLPMLALGFPAQVTFTPHWDCVLGDSGGFDYKNFYCGTGHDHPFCDPADMLTDIYRYGNNCCDRLAWEHFNSGDECSISPVNSITRDFLPGGTYYFYYNEDGWLWDSCIFDNYCYFKFDIPDAVAPFGSTSYSIAASANPTTVNVNESVNFSINFSKSVTYTQQMSPLTIPSVCSFSGWDRGGGSGSGCTTPGAVGSNATVRVLLPLNTDLTVPVSPDSFAWDFENNGSWDFVSTTTGSASHSYPAAGTYTAKARVEVDGVFYEDTVEIRVRSCVINSNQSFRIASGSNAGPVAVSHSNFSNTPAIQSVSCGSTASLLTGSSCDGANCSFNCGPYSTATGSPFTISNLVLIDGSASVQCTGTATVAVTSAPPPTPKSCVVYYPPASDPTGTRQVTEIILVGPSTYTAQPTCYSSTTAPFTIVPCLPFNWSLTPKAPSTKPNGIINPPAGLTTTFTSKAPDATYAYGTSTLKATASSFNCSLDITTLPAPSLTNDAQCVSYNFINVLDSSKKDLDNLTMAPGETRTVSVTMKNIGTTTWITGSADGKDYKLGAQFLRDNSIWGFSRVLLDSGDSIAPNAEKTFTFTITAPSTVGTYSSKWKMLRESVEWFPSPTDDSKGLCGPSTITVAEPAKCEISPLGTIAAPVNVLTNGTQPFSVACKTSTDIPIACPAMNWTTDSGAALNPLVPLTGLSTIFTAQSTAKTGGYVRAASTTPSFHCDSIVNVTGINDAECVSYNFGGSSSGDITMAAGDILDASVTMKNTGTTIWIDEDSSATSDDGKLHYRLGYPAQNPTVWWGLNRVLLNSGETIGPSNQKTFSFQIKAPLVTVPTTYSGQWKMVQEWKEWFGEPCGPASIIVNPTTNPLASLLVKEEGTPPPFLGTVTINSGEKVDLKASCVNAESCVLSSITCSSAPPINSANNPLPINGGNTTSGNITGTSSCTVILTATKGLSSDTDFVTINFTTAPPNLCTTVGAVCKPTCDPLAEEVDSIDPSCNVNDKCCILKGQPPGTGSNLRIVSVDFASLPDISAPLTVLVGVKNFGSAVENADVNVSLKETLESPIDAVIINKDIPAGSIASFSQTFISGSQWDYFKEAEVYTVIVKLQDPVSGTVLDVAEKQFTLKMEKKNVPEASPLLAVVVLVAVLLLVFRKNSK